MLGACDMDDITTLCNEISLVCGNLALKMDKLPLALDLVNRVLDKSPYDKTALMLLAKTHLLKNEYHDVIELLQAVDKDRKLWEVFSLACYKVANFDKAVEAIAHCEELEADEEEDFHDEGSDRELDLKFGSQHLECRILLLADLDRYPLEVTMPRFERTLKLTQRSNRPSIHLEALFTRAQLFEKNNQWVECCNDLKDSIDILQSPGAINHFHVKDFLFKATFAFIYKIFLTWKMHASTQEIDHLFEIAMGFSHTARTLQSLNLAQFIYRMLSRQSVDISGLLNEVPSYSEELQPFAYYIAARALLEYDLPQKDAKAHECLQMSLKLNKMKPHVWISMGSLFLKTNRISDALSAYSQAIQLSNSMGDIHSSISKHLLQRVSENLKALAYFGASQAYMIANDMGNALTALKQCLGYLSGDDKDQMERGGLEDLIQVLSSPNPVDLETLKESLTMPEIPLSLFLNPMFYLKESQVFQIKSTILDGLLIALKAIPPTTFPIIESDVSIKQNKNNDNKVKKRVVKKPHDLARPTKLRKRKNNDIFRRANLSISKNKHITIQHKKKQAHALESDKTTTASTNHPPSYDDASISECDLKGRINESSFPQDSHHTNETNNTTSIENVNFPSIPSSNIYESRFIPHQQQYGSPYSNTEQSHLSRASPFNHSIIPASNTTSIYPHPASMIHYYQPVDFPASASFYYPQQSLEEAYRNNSNGIDTQSSPQNFGQPVLMPQFPNQFYHSDRPRFTASALATPTTSYMAPQLQQRQQQHPSLLAERANYNTNAGDASNHIASYRN